ncbi:hypothetical protein [Undibacterium danionis]|uniref:Thioredoxin domain-containing protein n=1 Tax=Undibacterium danionis TaxID=1812100 RepID=A0ABV6IF73_9BURK
MTHLPTYILAGCIAMSVSAAHAQSTMALVALSPASQDVVVRSASELERRMQAGATPLDALTPYGRREFMRGLQWGTKGLSGFSYAALRRELLPDQIMAIAKFLDFEPHVKSLLADAGRFPPLRLPEPDAVLEQRIVAFKTWMDTQSQAEANSSDVLTRNDHSILLSRFEQDFAAELQSNYVEQAKDGDLVLLFQLSHSVAFVALSPASAQALNRIYQVLKVRGLETRRGIDKDMLEILLRQREFEKARVFVTQHPDLNAEVIPRIEDKLPASFRGRSVYNYDPQSNTLTRTAVKLSVGKQLVVVVGAGCHFSQDALAAISKNVFLQQHLLNANLLIITPPSESIPFHFIQQWNAKHPDMAMVAAARGDEWKDIDVPSVPMFYLYENGRLQKKFEGWYPETTMRDILSALGKK